MDTGAYVSIAVVIIGIAFLIIYRQDIKGAISRLRSIDKSGIAFDSGQKEKTPERTPRDEAEALLRELDNKLVLEIEDKLKEELRKRNLAGDEALRVVKRYFAATVIALGFEMTYRVIWGSQISLLHYLNTQSLGQPLDALRPFYVSASKQYPDAYKGYAFEQWIGYLKMQLLIRDDAGLIRITIRGRELLTYLTRMGMTIDKAG